VSAPATTVSGSAQSFGSWQATLVAIDDESSPRWRYWLVDVPAPVGRQDQVEARLLGSVSSAPLLRLSQPLDCAVWTMCSGSARARPFGVP
jgi:hypothetical protein